MFVKTLIPAFLATVVTALPSQAFPQRSVPSNGSGLTLSLPSSSLPTPPNSTVLKYVALGTGAQNYTCAKPYSTATPVSDGAKAWLYDIGEYLEKNPAMIPNLPPMALRIPSVSSELSLLGFRLLGEHDFNKQLQPVFNLYVVGAQLVAKKVGDVSAPPSACPGPDKTGAVDWLYLTDGSNGDGATFGGISVVYRVETDGGKPPPSCIGSPAIFGIQYSAEYWIYGPPNQF